MRGSRPITKLPRCLYRALRREEISAGCVPIPKSQHPFIAHPKLPNILPFDLGEHVEHAVRDHQWVEKDAASGGLKPLHETSGVSTTPHYGRALHYARNKVIIRIDTALFESHHILAYSVGDNVDQELICVPEDDEIILVCENGCQFPKEVILEIIKL